MSDAVLETEAALQALGAAINKPDAQAIIAASEALAVAVSRLSAATPRVHDDRRQYDAITDMLAQLDLLARQVNIHGGWTRQRIDSLTELRRNGQLMKHRYC
jgi:hypothetical protein